MTAPGASTAPLSHPLAGSLLAFCLLPSRLLHPSRRQTPFPAAPADLGDRLTHLHRHLSADMLRTQPLDAPLSLDNAELALALLPTGQFEQLVSLGGLTLVGNRLRRCIRQADVAWLRERWSDPVLDFIRRRASALHPGLDDAVNWSLSETSARVPALGSALVARAVRDAPSPIADRALLRLPLDAPEQAQGLPLSAPEALALSLLLTQEINPQWLSLFPAIH